MSEKRRNHWARAASPERRREPRLMCADLVDVLWQDELGAWQKETANLEDISEHGLCVQLEREIPVGTQVRVQCGEVEIPGEIRYCREELYGWFYGVAMQPGTQWPKDRFQPKHLFDPQSLEESLSDDLQEPPEPREPRDG